MKFTKAVDEYMADMRRVGRHRSPNTEDSYRRKLYARSLTTSATATPARSAGTT